MNLLICYNGTAHLHSCIVASTFKVFILAPPPEIISQYLGEKQRRELDIFDMILFTAKDCEELITSAKFLAYIFQVQALSQDHTNIFPQLLYVFWQLYASHTTII